MQVVVAEFQSYVESDTVTFDSSSTVVLPGWGLNDHTLVIAALVVTATEQQVATLYSLGARLFEIALLPADVPAFRQFQSRFTLRS